MFFGNNFAAGSYLFQFKCVFDFSSEGLMCPCGFSKSANYQIIQVLVRVFMAISTPCPDCRFALFAITFAINKNPSEAKGTPFKNNVWGRLIQKFAQGRNLA